ncbi:hypothetical protein ACI01nite_25360 [Acetobacter cibinongensis]|uniref:Uncharacterized protein n=1 Tax=Acetobacter cibinongensis TaxID=146475 RepID=A0A0D6N7U6_9PROT|nr:hypothetical protein [Acetobacter cibinongensis]GAN61571.1 hypothetical protein Abci_046_004 [Acetobacter cibinongensis]GBQ17710.1 hypothetical protein AA0482_1992 [Acetobacter cibinongensis NRIC 0482]GEL59934.1 hypothetical protein ACI01nite_25360 [Acetobacter cibinongensis]
MTTQIRINRADQLHAQADTLFVAAERIEQFSRACAASNNPEGSACWQRIAKIYLIEAEAFAVKAEKITGKRS